MTANTLLGVNNLLWGGITALRVSYPIWAKRSEVTGSVVLGSISAVKGPDLPLRYIVFDGLIAELIWLRAAC